MYLGVELQLPPGRAVPAPPLVPCVEQICDLERDDGAREGAGRYSAPEQEHVAESLVARPVDVPAAPILARSPDGHRRDRIELSTAEPLYDRNHRQLDAGPGLMPGLKGCGELDPRRGRRSDGARRLGDELIRVDVGENDSPAVAERDILVGAMGERTAQAQRHVLVFVREAAPEANGPFFGANIELPDKIGIIADMLVVGRKMKFRLEPEDPLPVLARVPLEDRRRSDHRPALARASRAVRSEEQTSE